jgi:WD40-like Beta Propeller Repeat
MRHFLILGAAMIVSASAASLGACGSDDSSTFGNDAAVGGDSSAEAGDPFLDGLTGMDITPANAIIEATPSKAGTQAYTVTGHFNGAPDKDITSHTTFGISDSTLGSFAGAAFSSGVQHGGKSTVLASAGNASASTGVTVHFTASINGQDNGTALPADPSKSFTGTASASRTPKFAYPNDNTMLPPNLALLDVHWEPGGASNTLFQLSFESATTDVKVYLRCPTPAAAPQPQPINNGCVFPLDSTTYAYLAGSNRGGDPVTFRVRGSDDAADGFGESATVKVSFAQTDLQGGLYYWTTTSEAIMRFDFGNPTKAPEVFLNAANVNDTNQQNGGNCVGCHSISRDGTKIIASLDGEGAGWQILDNNLNTTLTGKITGDTTNSVQFASFNPAGDRFVSVADGNDDPTRNTLFMNDGTTGARIAAESMTQPNLVDHPDWSPDGNKIAFTHPTSLSGNFKQTPYQSGIDVIAKTGSTWSAASPLVASLAGKNRFNPNFSPDSSIVIFTESTCQTGTTNDDSCDADADPAARTWAVKASGGAPFELANANAPGVEDTGVETSDTFPRFAPFVEPQGTSKLLWVTVASARDAGVLVPPGSGTRHGRWLWMFAIDLTKLSAGQDGSYAAFYLPFQDLTTSNHIGQWTTKVVGSPPPR